MRAKHALVPASRPTAYKWLAVLALGAICFAALGADGCGSATDADPTPVKTFKITPATGSQRSPTPAVTPSVVAASPTASTPGAGATVDIAGVSSTFDKETLETSAGLTTIVFDNRDSGVVHNIHFFRGDDAGGEDVGNTDLETGPTTQTLELDLTPGDYFYQCDAHPNTMNGTLRVTP